MPLARRRARALLLAASMGVGCAGHPKTPEAPAAPLASTDWSARVFAANGGVETSVTAMLDALADVDIVLVGETHLDAATHEMEVRILEGIAQRKSDNVALSMEMFQRDVQAQVDAYLAGKLSEDAFLETARPWHNYRTGYRSLVETAKARGFPVVASNLPASLQMAFARGGAGAHEKLEAADAQWLPADIFPPQQSYWNRVDRRLRDAGHGSPGKLSEADRTWSIQNLWDNCMADSAVTAHEPGKTVVHVAGAFHVEHGDGIAAQIRARDPQLTVATVTLVSASSLAGPPPDAEELDADYVVWVPRRARGPESGQYAVNITTELRYRISAPEAPDGPRPLLIWLGGAGTSTKADEAYWSAVTAGEAIVVVVEPPYRSEQPDLHIGGRWTWPDTYSSDVGELLGGVNGIAEYVSAYWPVSSVVVAGEGDGAAVALWAGLHNTVDGASVLALHPSDLDRLGDAGVPEAELASAPVVVLSTQHDEARTTLELAGRTVVGEQPRPAELRQQAATLMRKQLGLTHETASGQAAKVLSLSVDTPLARQWAKLLAQARETDTAAYRVVLGPVEGAETIAVRPADFADGLALPLAPGAFGGTTMLVIPANTPKADRDAWQQLGRDDVIKKQSRFARVVVTTDEDLGVALDELAESGRRNVLVVPAAFAASAKRMRDLQRRTLGHADDLHLAWLPGLGGHWAARLAASQTNTAVAP